MPWFLDKAFLERLDLRGYDAPAIARRLGLDVDVVAAFVDPARRYLVQTNEAYGWLAGASGDGLPTLVFFGAPRLSGGGQAPINVVVCQRDATVTTRALPAAPEVLDDGEAFLDLLAEELGFVHVGSAPVVAFVHPELWHYAVVPFPFHLHDDAIGANPDASPEELDAVRAWIEDGSFVVQAGNAYFLDADGEVTSS